MDRILNDRLAVSGTVSPPFESVRAEFERNFVSRGERGAALTIYHQGQKVVDLCGGHRCQKRRHRWQPDTLSLAFSVTKGMAAAAMVVAHSRGLFELDEPIATYWPEFAQHGKNKITVRQLLSHQGGLIHVGQRLNSKILADHDELSKILAAQRPQWLCGARHGYHTLTLGWYQNELIRRTDPQGRSLGRFFHDEIAQPLGVDFYIGLPDDVPEERLSTVKGYHRFAVLAHLNQLPTMMVLSGIWPRSLVAKSIHTLRIDNPAEVGGPELRRVEIPSANGIGSAQAVARIYDVLVRGGAELKIRPDTYQELIAPPRLPNSGCRDAILKIETKYGFGFSRPSTGFPFGTDVSSFGCPGAGGSFGMADPVHGISLAYITNTMSFRIFDDPRERAVRQALYQCLRQVSQRPAATAA